MLTTKREMDGCVSSTGGLHICQCWPSMTHLCLWQGPVRYNLLINDGQWRHSWLAKSEAPVCIFCLICAWTLSDWWWVVSQHFTRTWDACRIVWTLTPSQHRKTWVKVKINKTNKTTGGGVNVGLGWVGIAHCRCVGPSVVAMVS